MARREDPDAPLLGGDARALPPEALALLRRVPAELLPALARCAARDLTRDKLQPPATAETEIEVDPLGSAAGEAACAAALEARVAGLAASAARGVYASMCALVALCARESGAPRRALHALGLEDGAFLDALAAAVGAATPGVKQLLERTNFDAAHVVDVSWRLDYALESASGGSVHAPRYLVELTLQRPEDGARDALRFSCSVEQLRDLVYRVQDAASQLERLATAAPA